VETCSINVDGVILFSVQVANRNINDQMSNGGGGVDVILGFKVTITYVNVIRLGLEKGPDYIIVWNGVV
jgi:hypothetical protein